MRSILCLSGWGQSFNSLEINFSKEILEKFTVSSINYSKFSGFKNFKDSISLTLDPDVMIGWSLGGQLALRLIREGIAKPKLLVLIAPPFQMVKDSRVNAGMTIKTYNDFYNNLSLAPNETLKKFLILSIMNDKNKSQIIKNLEITEENNQNLLIWLQELKDFSCFDLDFKSVPQTLYFIGLGDMVVHHSQAKYFAERITNFELHEFKNCGHAPHLNNPELFNEILIKKLKSLNFL